MLSTATDDSPMGRVISIEEASPNLLHSLKNRIDIELKFNFDLWTNHLKISKKKPQVHRINVNL